ncbi:hypothetical protein [Streptomyces sp. NPDC058867]|uniref:hypothetical protein n=1 Tax=unclassified Streptomyces TaxID=2593676 RepID=UPI0036AC572F
MSHTAHHVPNRHRSAPPYWPRGTAGPCTAHALVDLRHSHAETARAAREGRRPRPRPVVRSFAAYTWPRALGKRPSGPYETRARAELRAFRGAALRRLRAAPPGALHRVAEELDHPPTRHRHRDLWES